MQKDRGNLSHRGGVSGNMCSERGNVVGRKDCLLE